MTTSTLYAVTVPATEDSRVIVEDLCMTFVSGEAVSNPDSVLMLRVAVAEAFQNAISQEPVVGGVRLVRVVFYRQRLSATNGLAMEITDPGPGLVVAGQAPPYPRELVGREIGLCRAVDHRIIARVKSPHEVRLRARQIDLPPRAEPVPPRDLLTGRPTGLGLLALCRGWQRVVFRHVPGEGNLLRLESPRLNDEPLDS
jgi:hypothetical protein